MKERAELQLVDSKSDDLSAEENERLAVLKEGLRRLMASETEEEIKWRNAAKLANGITETALTGTMDQVLEIRPYPADETIETQSVQSYFVNERIDLLISKSEVDRVDYRKKSGRTIFLAEWKYWLGLTTRTTHACVAVLVAFMGLCLTITVFVLQMKNQRVD